MVGCKKHFRARILPLTPRFQQPPCANINAEVCAFYALDDWQVEVYLWLLSNGSRF